MHEGDDKDEGGGGGELPVTPLGLDDEELSPALVAPPVVPLQEEELLIPVSPPLCPGKRPRENEVGEEPSLRGVFAHTTMAVRRPDIVERVPPLM